MNTVEDIYRSVHPVSFSLQITVFCQHCLKHRSFDHMHPRKYCSGLTSIVWRYTGKVKICFYFPHYLRLHNNLGLYPSLLWHSMGRFGCLSHIRLRGGIAKNGTSQSTAVREEFLYHPCMLFSSVSALNLHQPVTAPAEGGGKVECSFSLVWGRRLL